MTVVQAKAKGLVRTHALPAWIPIAAVLLGAGWGSNQFTPMLLVYHRTLGLGAGTLEALFGAYALGLVPGLLVGGARSDAYGRRPVVVSAAALSLAASVVLSVAGRSVAVLFMGRLLAGLGSGAAFSAGTAWLREASVPPVGGASERGASRRAAVAMTVGFALGPLISGMLAQWAPAPRVVPYLPHLALMIVVLVLVRGAPETVREHTSGAVRQAWPTIRSRRFWTAVAPMAPWVFAAPAIAFALLPNVVGADHAHNGIALTAAITMLCAVSGVLIQPLARGLDARAGRNRAAIVGLLIMVAGLSLATLTAHDRESWLLVPSAIILGAAYGMCLIAGLLEVHHLASDGALAGLTATYYALTYVGFAAPYLLALAAQTISYTSLLMLTAALALVTTIVVAGQPVGAAGR